MELVDEGWKNEKWNNNKMIVFHGYIISSKLGGE